jgi:hypothetical protein
LLRLVWGPGHVHDAQLLRTHIANLRRKLASPRSGGDATGTEHAPAFTCVRFDGAGGAAAGETPA